MTAREIQKYDPADDAANVPAVSESAAILQVIERAATNPNVDIDKMERLFAMHERMKEREARLAFDRALAAAKADIPVVIKNKYNKQTQSRYADLAAIAAVIDPVLAKYGFSTSFGTDQSALENHYGVTCELTHEGGHSRHYRLDIPATTTGIKGNAMMTPTHAFGSAMSYGRRYLKCLILDLATGDDDGNAASGVAGPITVEQAAQIRELLEKAGANAEKFCRYYRIEAIPELPASSFDDAIARIHATAARRAT